MIYSTQNIDYRNVNCECCNVSFARQVDSGISTCKIPSTHHVIPKSFQEKYGVVIHKYTVLCRKCHDHLHQYLDVINVEDSILNKKFNSNIYSDAMRNAQIAKSKQRQLNFVFIARGVFSRLNFFNLFIDDCELFYEELYNAWLEFERELLHIKSCKHEKRYIRGFCDERIVSYAGILEYFNPT